MSYQCRKCGQVYEGKFCPKCGTPKEQELICPICGAKHAEGALFCAECGAQFTQTAQPMQTAQPASVAQSTPVVPARSAGDSAVKFYPLLKKLPAFLFLLFSALLFLFFLAPVAVSHELGVSISFGNVYELMLGGELSDPMPSLIVLFAFGLLSLIGAIFCFVVRFFTKGKGVCVGGRAIEWNTILQYVAYFFYLLFFIASCVMYGYINAEDGGLGLINGGACPALLLSFSLIFGLCALTCQILKWYFAKKYPAVSQLKQREKEEFATLIAPKLQKNLEKIAKKQEYYALLESMHVTSKPKRPKAKGDLKKAHKTIVGMRGFPLFILLAIFLLLASRMLIPDSKGWINLKEWECTFLLAFPLAWILCLIFFYHPKKWILNWNAEKSCKSKVLERLCKGLLVVLLLTMLVVVMVNKEKILGIGYPKVVMYGSGILCLLLYPFLPYLVWKKKLRLIFYGTKKKRCATHSKLCGNECTVCGIRLEMQGVSLVENQTTHFKENCKNRYYSFNYKWTVRTRDLGAL